jgi:hypothetical protein
MRLSTQAFRPMALLAALILTVFAAKRAESKTAQVSQPKACVKVVRACQKGGFVPGKANKHPGQGLLANCVRPLAKGRKIKGVSGVSKSAAQACLKARRAVRARKG